MRWHAPRPPGVYYVVDFLYPSSVLAVLGEVIGLEHTSIPGSDAAAVAASRTIPAEVFVLASMLFAWILVVSGLMRTEAYTTMRLDMARD